MYHILTIYEHTMLICEYQNYWYPKMQKYYLDNIVKCNIQITFEGTKHNRL